jgi:predicted metal-dependent peptidase
MRKLKRIMDGLVLEAVVSTAQAKPKPTVIIDITEYMQEMILDPDAEMAYYSYVMQRTRRIATDKIKTLAVGIETGGFVMYYNPEFVSTLTYKQFCYVIKHELLHIILGHHDRAGEKGNKLDNIAMDLAINSMLGEIDMDLMYPGKPCKDEHGNIVEPFKDFPQGESYEEYYNRLLKQCEKQKKPKPGEGDPIPGGTEGIGGDQENGDTPVSWEGHKMREDSKGEVTEAIAKRVLTDAYKACKAMGKLPGNLERIIEGRLKAKVNWKTQIRRFHGQFHVTGQTYTSKRAHRRYPKLAGIIPGVRNKYSSKLLVALDCSGSCFDENVFRAFLSEIKMIPVPYTLITADTQVQDMVKVRKGKNLRFKQQKGGGGTDFRPVFEYAKKGGYEGVIFLTDMYGSFPDSYNKPTLWVSISGETSAPFGKVIQLKLAEQA